MSEHHLVMHVNNQGLQLIASWFQAWIEAFASIFMTYQNLYIDSSHILRQPPIS